MEPQTGPPDGPNLAPRVVVPGDPLRIEMTWRWAPDDAGGPDHADDATDQAAGEADPEAEPARRR
jgi:hypothetical protein